MRIRDFEFYITTDNIHGHGRGHIQSCSGAGVGNALPLMCQTLGGTWTPPTSAATAPGTCTLPTPTLDCNGQGAIPGFCLPGYTYVYWALNGNAACCKINP